MSTDGVGEAGTSQLQFRCKEGYITNIYLTDSGEEAVVYFINHHEELYNKSNEHFKEKTRMDCL